MRTLRALARRRRRPTSDETVPTIAEAAAATPMETIRSPGLDQLQAALVSQRSALRALLEPHTDDTVSAHEQVLHSAHPTTSPPDDGARFDDTLLAPRRRDGV